MDEADLNFTSRRPQLGRVRSDERNNDANHMVSRFQAYIASVVFGHEELEACSHHSFKSC